MAFVAKEARSENARAHVGTCFMHVRRVPTAMNGICGEGYIEKKEKKAMRDRYFL